MVAEDTATHTESVHTEVLESFEEDGDTAMSYLALIGSGGTEKYQVPYRGFLSEVASQVPPECGESFPKEGCSLSV